MTSRLFLIGSLLFVGVSPHLTSLDAAETSGLSKALAAVDFTKPGGTNGWRALHGISALESTAEGLRVRISGDDPYFAGPPFNLPADVPLWLHLRVRSDVGGGGQVFYFRDGPKPDAAVNFSAKRGEWQDVRVKLPPLGPGFRFRIDPPGQSGTMLLAALRVEARPVVKPPNWTPSVSYVPVTSDPAVHAGELQLQHGSDTLGSWQLTVAGTRMAGGHNRPMLGYMQDGQVRWITLGASAATKARVQGRPGKIIATVNLADSDGARWQIDQQFAPDHSGKAIEVETRVTVDRDRPVVFLPLFQMLAGVGSYGTNKTQGLLAGVEYLENEPSSSEADLRGPGARRLVPDTLKITFPLMAIVAQERYVALNWERAPQVAALFDSPDRQYQSGGHLLGLLFPGSNGENRDEGSLVPEEFALLRARQPLVARVTVLGGRGRSVIPAVQEYVRRHGLPPFPLEPSLQEYVGQAAGGWLDSQIREGNRFRHALWPGGHFGAHPAADAAVYMEWLAGRTTDAALARRLKETAGSAINEVAPAQRGSASVSHVRVPVAPLVYGPVLPNVRQAAEIARQQLRRFGKDGGITYQAPAGKPDFGSTHWSREANGLTAQVVMTALESAVFSGKHDLVELALARLRDLNKFRDTVPRGAQTWEIPLHTPDILASAHLVRAYTLGFELTGDETFLEQARFWAWTGVPFVYFVNPADQPIGPYATIAVLGATHWVAPVWIGLPVQWCGLVYGDALNRLAPHDPQGPWRRLADGIAVAGIQISWPKNGAERQGLLPDVFHLRDQNRDGPAINPGTVQASAVRLFAGPPLCDFRALRQAGWHIHAPGGIKVIEEQTNRAKFQVEGWPKRPYFVLINRCEPPPRVTVDGKPVELAAPNELADGNLVLQVTGRSVIELAKGK